MKHIVSALLGSVRQYKKDSFLAPLFVGLEVVMECLLPLLMADVIDSMSGDSMTPIVKDAVALLILALLSLLFGTMSGVTAATAATGFAKNLRQDLFFKVQDFAFLDIDRFSASSLVTRLTTDVTNVQNAYGIILRIAVRTPLMMIFAVAMSLTQSVRMSMIFIVMIPVALLALFGIIFKAMPIFRRIFRKYDALNNSVQENVSGIRVVKAFVREDHEIEKFHAASEDVRKDFTAAEKLIAMNFPTLSFFVYVAMMLISFFGALIIVNTKGSEFSTGELSALITYGMQILMSVMMLSMIFVMITMAAESAKRIVEVLDHEGFLESPENGITEVKDGNIVFDHVNFRYSNHGNEVLDDIELTIPSGATVGIIGATGSSKSTFIQLIPRLYDVTGGKLLVGGTDVRDYDLKALRDSVAVVLQKNVLFHGTIRDNMRWGKKDATDEEIIRACRLAQADEFVQQFPDGYDTMIDRGGTNVSGGQKQRLCIARALLKHPKILILDDSTSAVDTKTDALIRKAFREEIPETTKIIIAQRTSSVEDADMIIVMDDGRIVERGTHEELMNRGGIYREIYDSQNSGSIGEEVM